MKRNLTAAAVVFSAVFSWADVKIDPVFSSNMVLQQQKPITFFGSADQGDRVEVEFNGKKRSVKADGSGKWEAKFPAMKAGHTKYTVRITDGKKSIELKDVLIGEVWFCSGQSNMQMPIGKVFRRGRSTANASQEVANANYPEIRFADQRMASSHGKELPAQYLGWMPCSPESAWCFSASAYFFGRQLYRDLKVPIGLIHSSWGGTCIQTWISNAGYETFGPERDLAEVRKYRLSPAEKKAFEKKAEERFAEEMAKWHALFVRAGARAAEQAKDWFRIDLNDSNWSPGVAAVPDAYLVRWFRCRFELSAASTQSLFRWFRFRPASPDAEKNGKILFCMRNTGEKIDVYLNGKRIAGWRPDTLRYRKNIRIALDPELFRPDGNVLAVRGEYYSPSSGRSQMQNLLQNTFLIQEKVFIPLDKNWKMKDEFSCTKALTEEKPAPVFSLPYMSHQFHSNLYNGMTAAWTRLPIRGVIWYQGCSNSGQIQYYLQLKTLIADWRARWNDPEMPFLIMQLAGYEPGRADDWQTADPNRPSGFSLTRDIQLQMLKIPNVGLACGIDIGEADNIHPANKQDVGKRLALEAERIAYKMNIVSRGPLFLAAKPENGSIRVFFQYADKGLKTSDGKAPGAFAIAGENKQFFWAEAKIDGKTVVVSSPKVKNPKYVRYAYMGYRGDCNLQNTEGLPAYPFRSDAIDYSKIK